jgi:muramoyltetrapeptide carboxypeptidase
MAKKSVNKKSWAALKPGDIVDVVAPGFSVSDEKLVAGVKFLEDLGLRPRVPSDIFGPDILCAQKDSVRLQHLQKAVMAKDSKAIWCVRGGYGAIRLLEAISKWKKPSVTKLFVGYSDATTLHNYFNHFWGWPTLHGPLLDRLGQHTLPLEQVSEMMDVVFGVREQVVMKGLHPLNAAARKKQKISGRVLGGNLVVTQSHLGTRFAKSPKGSFLFFEDIGERGYRVDRVLLHLRMAGYFQGVKGILFGDFVSSDEPNGGSRVPDVLQRFAEEIKIPVFSGLEVGHGSFQRPLPLNTRAILNCGPRGELIVDANL